jgi:hypothetical protein
LPFLSFRDAAVVAFVAATVGRAFCGRFSVGAFAVSFLLRRRHHRRLCRSFPSGEMPNLLYLI